MQLNKGELRLESSMKNPIQEIRSNDNINSPVRIALLYFAISTLWILLSEPLIARLVTDPLTPNLANAVKDWIFIVITTALLYWLIRHDRATLQASERRFRALIEHSADAISLADQDGKILYVSPAYSHIMGYTADEVVGHNVYDHLHPDEQGPMQARIAAVLSQPGKSFNAQVRQRHKDGRWLWLEGTATNLLNEPEIGAIVVNFRDITDRKLAEAKAKIQSAALEAAANGIVITDTNGAIEWINPAWSILTGYSYSEVVGHNPRILKSGKQLPEFYKTLWNTILAGEVWQSELVNKRRDGSLYTEEETITPVRDEQGKVTHFIAIKQDITERKQVEDQLRYHAMVLNQISDAVIATDLTFHINSWNQGAEKL
jgi:PAS domain S-box-containing protein